ncbi:hypothetical protein FOA52_002081 [Chlamydomonas sp. UWO 241]|nr:hypothetical protein FOA52_002081 [Chlamydomonas sp. UWO 241]
MELLQETTGTDIQDMQPPANRSFQLATPLVLTDKAVRFFWSEARREAGVPQIRPVAMRFARRTASVLSFGCFGLYTSTSRKAVYVRQPKVGNDNIKCNLQMTPGFPSGVLTREQTRPEIHSIELGRDAGLEAFQCQDAVVIGSATPLFTYVREPISKFISAYSEIEFRNVIEKNTTYGFDYESETLGSPQRFAVFVRWLLRGRMWTQAKRREEHAGMKDVLGETEMYHMMLSSGMFKWLAKPGIGKIYVGHLESLEDDWSATLSTFGLGPRPLDRTLCQHPSSSDELGTKAGAMAALEADPALQRALCWILLPDFAAFGYELPPACSGLSVHGRGGAGCKGPTEEAVGGLVARMQVADDGSGSGTAHAHNPCKPSGQGRSSKGAGVG